MPNPSKRKLARELRELTESESPADDSEFEIEWRAANPSERPSGMSYDADAQTLQYDVWDVQHDCLEALTSGQADIVGFLAGYGTGKSILGARWTIANAVNYPGSHFLAMGQSFSEARVSTFRKLFEQLPGARTEIRTSRFNGPEESPLVADYSRNEHRLTLVNDSVITLGSADSAARFAGAEFGGIWLDEPSHYHTSLHELLDMLGGRLRSVDGPKVQFWTLTGNGYNDAWEILEKREDAEGNEIGLDIKVVRGSTLDNPYLDDGDIGRFKRQYSETERAEQALYGGFAAAQGLVYSNFSRESHVVSHEEALDAVDDDWRIYGYDAGWNSPRVIVEVGKTSYDQLVVLDEFHRRETHVQDAIEWLDENKMRGKIFAEHENADIEEFQNAGYNAEKADKALDPGIEDVRAQLEGDDQGRSGLLVSKRCENLIREFLGYKEEQVGKPSAVDHCLDALRYAIHSSGAAKGRTTSQSTSNTFRKPIVRGVSTHW